MMNAPSRYSAIRSTTSIESKYDFASAASGHCITTAASAATQAATPSQARPARLGPRTNVSASRTTQPMPIRISIGV